MALRFANGLFEPIWNRDHIDHVQITVAETVGVEERGKFYEKTGALRDMVPNHLFQLVAMTAMEPPDSFDADAVRTEEGQGVRGGAIRSRPERRGARPIWRRHGAAARQVAAYREEPNVAPDSSIETFVALKLMIDNWRWAGRAVLSAHRQAHGQRSTEIAIRFKQRAATPCSATRRSTSCDANWLILQIQPDEGISPAVQRQACRARRCARKRARWSSTTRTGSSRRRASAMRR